MKTVMIAAPNSGSGKTTAAIALARALVNRGFRVSCLKTGPDYIDTAFLTAASGRRAGNLDLHLQGEKGVKQSFSLAEGDLCLVESAMGYFDGVSNTWRASSFDLAERLGIVTVLVYTPRGEMFSAVPKIKGMVDFSGRRIRGLILNQVQPRTYRMLKEQVERYAGIKVLGYLPPMEDAVLKSRHLGLVQSQEVEDLEGQIELLAGAACDSIDLGAFTALAGEVHGDPFPQLPRRRIRVAIACDEAFSFYYRENLALLEMVAEVSYFSPLADSALPPCDLLYLGGGYPELHAGRLSANREMADAIRNFAEKGGAVYAECGGMLYLGDKLEGESMVGLLSAESRLTGKLQRFGYVIITLLRDCLLGRAGDVITAHEFHKSCCTGSGEPVFRVDKVGDGRSWQCGYRYKNVTAAYPHVNFLGNMASFEHMLSSVESTSRGS